MISEVGLTTAREALREYQKSAAEKARMVDLAHREYGAEAAVQHLLRQQQFEPTADPHIVRRGAFKFERESELDRLRRAEALIRRADPGPYEDANYLALVAYQAASLEMAFSSESDGNGSIDWSRFVLGTAASHSINAFSDTLKDGRCSVIILYSALIDFMYQAAKCLASAQGARLSDDPHSDVQADSNPERVLERLRNDPSPCVRLYKTLEAYFFEGGYPRAFANEVVDPAVATHLKFLVGLAERWVIAHEFGHGIAQQWGWSPPPDAPQRRAIELNADVHATVLTVMSAHKLDHLPPELPLASAIFALACQQIVWEAAQILANGTIPEVTDDVHPTPRDRVQHVMKTFVQYFDVKYWDERRHYELRYVAKRTDARTVTGNTRAHLERATNHAQCLRLIWEPVKEYLRRDYQSRRALHSKWE